MKPLVINSYTLTCAMGVGLTPIREAVDNQQSGLSSDAWFDCELDTHLGRVKRLDETEITLPAEWQSRNNKLAELGLQQDNFLGSVEAAKAKYGAHRCGLVIGTSTSSIGRTEEAYRQLNDHGQFALPYQQEQIHNPHAPGAYLQQRLGIRGPAQTISTACSSSAKSLATAARWLQLGIVDAVVVGGVDSLCQSVVYGFNSLQLVAQLPCQPFDIGRSGISLGEAAGYAILTREALDDSGVRLLGYGESSDAYHMSSAHPDGLGAQLAMSAAIERSGLTFSALDYLNLHGTGTRTNDEIETRVCNATLQSGTVCSSTKGWTGHTLGAAGICEAILTIESIRNSLIPGTLNTSNPEPDIEKYLALNNVRQKVRYAMSNSFGFGGNNCSLVFGVA